MDRYFRPPPNSASRSPFKFSQNCLCIVPLLPVSSLALESISLQKTLLCSEINDILSQNFNRTQIFQVYLESQISKT